MANEVQVRLPNFAPLLNSWFDRLAFIDIAVVEEEIGLRIDDFKSLAQAVGMDNLVYCAYRAERDRLEQATTKEDGKPSPISQTLDNLIGGPAGLKGGKKLRRILTSFYAATHHLPEYVLRIRVPSESAVLEPFESFVNEAIAKILREDGVGAGTKQPPRYTVTAIGRGHESAPGHSAKIENAVRAQLKSKSAAQS